MLRKEIIATHPKTSGGRAAAKDIARIATVLVTSEDAEYPIDHVFDHHGGRGASRWIAEQSGEQTVILAFDVPQKILRVVVEVEETHIGRTQEMDVSISGDGGHTYRELVRQEYTFSPPGTTFEHEEWSVNAEDVSHFRLRIKPDKGDKVCRATLTTLLLE